MSKSQLAILDGAELMKQCGQNLRDSSLWAEFYSRYRRRILLFLLRAFCRLGGRSDEFVEYADDWIQEVFTKLVQNGGRVILSFRGTTELSVYAFLCCIAGSVVADQLRSQRAMRRSAKTISINEALDSNLPHSSDHALKDLLELIDLERSLLGDQESKNPERDFLIFKLHFVDGLTSREIAAMPGLRLTRSGLEKVLERVRNRLAKKQGL